MVCYGQLVIHNENLNFIAFQLTSVNKECEYYTFHKSFKEHFFNDTILFYG
jgi:hypothetical protein